MKKSIIIITMIFLLATTLSCAQEKAKDAKPITDKDVASFNEIEWLEDYDVALQEASAQEKVVLINFTGSDWCGWCIKLVDEVFSKAEFANYAKENLIMLKLDFPTTFQKLPREVQARRNELQQKYGVRGYPTILLTDSQGDVIGQTGYQAGGPVKYVEHLKEIINKTKK